MNDSYADGFKDGLNWAKALASMLGGVAAMKVADNKPGSAKSAALRGASTLAQEFIKQIDEHLAAIDAAEPGDLNGKDHQS
ncbi:MAG: hypothetical protein EPO02_12935 [Nitrospirae bacterium]|nr:MAG: hypothetical protein EPO02_12935 [Nitrospirota bacterium]